MIVPFLFVIGMAFLGIKLGRATRPTEIRGQLPESTHDESTHDESPLALMQLIERRGLTPEVWLISAAVRQAYEQGNWQLAASLADRYPPDYVPADRPTVDSVPAAPGTEVASPPSSDGPPSVPELVSPFPKLDDADWQAFVEVMCQHPVTFKGEKHLGCFHQRIDRVISLGIDPATLTTFEAQYGAFERECVDHLTKHEVVFRSAIATPVSVKGTAHPISVSGLLALFKAAGPKHAMEWVHSKDQQDQFPNTTKLFLKTNGLF